MVTCFSLLTWDAFALAWTTWRERSRRRLIDRALREWRGILQPPPLRAA